MFTDYNFSRIVAISFRLNVIVFLVAHCLELEPPAGIEPATFALRERRSTD